MSCKMLSNAEYCNVVLFSYIFYDFNNFLLLALFIYAVYFYTLDL